MLEIPFMMFSVVIPTHNRPEMLRKCVESLGRGYPHECYEIIIVDDGSEPSVDLREYAERPKLLVLRQANAGPARARNSGAWRASGKYLVFLDDDCSAMEGWLAKLEVACLTASPKTILGGELRNADTENLYSEVSEVFIRVILDFLQARQGNFYFFRATNLVAPREEFLRMGGFDEHLRISEDREFCDRWQSSCGEFQYVAGAIVIHHGGLTMRGFLQRHFAYGRGAYRFHRIRAGRNSFGHGLSSLVYYLRVFREVVRLKRGSLPVRIVLLVLWQAANLAGIICEMGRDITGAAE
jgi:glycosyltransferase involved in cell wall biosynthesis